MCRYDEAIADFTEAIRLAPEVPHAYYGRGWVYSKEGAKGKAETDFAEGKGRERIGAGGRVLRSETDQRPVGPACRAVKVVFRSAKAASVACHVRS